jgi:hypothetical protein
MTALSTALGWFSIALGAAELLAPRYMAQLVGVHPTDRTTTVFRAYGAREMASGIGILAQPTEPKWLWSRVGGDAVDLATLGQAARDERTRRTPLVLAVAAVAGVTVLDLLATRSAAASGEASENFGIALEAEQAITLKAALEAVEAAWTTWCASGHSRLKNNYAVRFEPAPGARGTEVHLSGGGSHGTIREELRRFKQLLETGEIPMTDGPGLWRPAQPAANPNDIRKLAEVL